MAAKHFKLDIAASHFNFEIDAVKVNEEAALDGIDVIRSSLTGAEAMGAKFGWIL